MRVEAEAAWHLGMLLDRYVSGANHAPPPQAHRKRQQLQARGHRPCVLVIDQLGYLPVDQESAHWLFEVVTRRYEKGSIILMSNPSRS
jgi:DNA replication protein DnaC